MDAVLSQMPGVMSIYYGCCSFSDAGSDVYLQWMLFFLRCELCLITMAAVICQMLQLMSI